MTQVTKHIGDLVITESNATYFYLLEEVTGSLYIRADAQLPVLTTVGGYLEISADAQLPVLTTVGGSLYIRADAQLPVLTTVGGYLYIRADAQLPVLTTVGGSLEISADAQLPVLRVAHGVEGRLIAVNKWGLWHSVDYKFYAGCQGPLTKRQALALSKTHKEKEVAAHFAAAIEAVDDENKAA